MIYLVVKGTVKGYGKPQFISHLDMFAFSDLRQISQADILKGIQLKNSHLIRLQMSIYLCEFDFPDLYNLPRHLGNNSNSSFFPPCLFQLGQELLGNIKMGVRRETTSEQLRNLKLPRRVILNLSILQVGRVSTE